MWILREQKSKDVMSNVLQKVSVNDYVLQLKMNLIKTVTYVTSKVPSVNVLWIFYNIDKPITITLLWQRKKKAEVRIMMF